MTLTGYLAEGMQDAAEVCVLAINAFKAESLFQMTVTETGRCACGEELMRTMTESQWFPRTSRTVIKAADLEAPTESVSACAACETVIPTVETLTAASKFVLMTPKLREENSDLTNRKAASMEDTVIVLAGSAYAVVGLVQFRKKRNWPPHYVAVLLEEDGNWKEYDDSQVRDLGCNYIPKGHTFLLQRIEDGEQAANKVDDDEDPRLVEASERPGPPATKDAGADETAAVNF